MNTDIRQLLEGVSTGSVSVEEAILALKRKPFEDIGYAKVDMHRKIRAGHHFNHPPVPGGSRICGRPSPPAIF